MKELVSIYMSGLGIFYEFVIRLIKFSKMVFFIKSYSKFLLNPKVNFLLNPILIWKWFVVLEIRVIAQLE